MKDIWILSVRTSLPKVCICRSDLETTFTVFDSFEKGRDGLRRIVKEFAFSKNVMFDGNGNITYLKKYAEDMPDEEIIDDLKVLDKSRVMSICEALRDAFSGKDFEYEPDSDFATDWFIAVLGGVGNILIRGEDDGPFNGYNPLIKTNIFSMKEEKDYYLYIDDLFGQDFSSELYIDLKKAEIK